MPNLSCPECGPQGGHGRVTLAISVVDCSLCDGNAPRGIAKHVSITEDSPGIRVARASCGEQLPETALERHVRYASLASRQAMRDALADIARCPAPLDRDSWAGHDDLRDAYMRAAMLDTTKEHAQHAALVDALVDFARPAAAPDGTLRWRLEPEQPVSAGTLGQYRAYLQTHSARYLAGKVLDHLPLGPAVATAKEVLSCAS